MNWYRIGAYMWTASAAGWLVLFILTHLPVCFVVSCLCGYFSFMWNVMAARRDAE